ncbi:MAG: phosphoribosylpyrophosphate synthetase [Cryomorphaceae bacterium]
MNLSFDTLSQAVNGLTEMGYTKDFNLKPDCIHCAADDIVLSPMDFEIDHIFRFEGMTNPGDSSIVYAISSRDGSIKGTMVDAYGAYADPLNAEMISKLQSHR